MKVIGSFDSLRNRCIYTVFGQHWVSFVAAASLVLLLTIYRMTLLSAVGVISLTTILDVFKQPNSSLTLPLCV